MALPPTLTRQYYRQRSNPRLPISVRAGAYLGRCSRGSRWLRASFDTTDIHKILRVSASTKHKLYLFYVDGEVRTAQARWLNKGWRAGFLDETYTICGVAEKVGGTLELGHGKKFKKCPHRSYKSPPGRGITYTENPPVKLLNDAKDVLVYTDSNVMSQLYPHNPDVFLMTNPPPRCAESFLKAHHDNNFFLQVVSPR